MVEIIEHADAAAQAAALAGLVAADVVAAAAAKGGARIAVPGGGTPKAFLAAFAEAPLNWREVTIVATDERWAPPDDARSNQRMIQEALGGRGWFFPFWREGETPTEAAGALSSFLISKGPLDSVVLGMGADRHCASLFPGAPELADAMSDEANLIAAITPPDGLEPRVTLTARALAEAQCVRLLITGDEKRRALEAAMTDPDPLTSPVGAILTRAVRAEAHWAP